MDVDPIDERFQFRRLVSEVAQNLNDGNKQTLVYVYDLPEDDKDKPVISILAKLQMRGKLPNPEALIEVLKVAKRADLVKDVEKQTKKWRKVRKKQEKAPKTDELKKKFDEIVEQAAALVEQVTKLGKEMDQKSEGHHFIVHAMLVECEKKADAVKRTCSLKQARSTAELSDGAQAKKEQLQKQLVNAVQGMSNLDIKKKVEDLENGKSVHSHTPLAHIATPTLGRRSIKKPPVPLPLPRARVETSIDTEPEPTYYDSNDLLKNKPQLRAGLTRPLSPARQRLNSNPEPSFSKSKSPIPVSQRRKDSESRTPQQCAHSNPTNHAFKQHISDATEPHQYVNVRETTLGEVYDKEDYTGSGDSGFGDAASLVKVPLTPHYTQLQPPQLEEREEPLYDTVQ